MQIDPTPYRIFKYHVRVFGMRSHQTALIPGDLEEAKEHARKFCGIADDWHTVLISKTEDNSIIWKHRKQ